MDLIVSNRYNSNMTHSNILIINAKVFTADNDLSNTEAVAIEGNRIVFVGSNADADAFRGPNTRVINAKGRTVMPRAFSK